MARTEVVVEERGVCEPGNRVTPLADMQSTAVHVCSVAVGGVVTVGDLCSVVSARCSGGPEIYLAVRKRGQIREHQLHSANAL